LGLLASCPFFFLFSTRFLVYPYHDPEAENSVLVRDSSANFLSSIGSDDGFAYVGAASRVVDDDTALLIRKTDVGVPEQVYGINYIFKRSVLDTKDVHVGDTTLINESGLDQTMAVQVQKRVRMQRTFVWQVPFSVAPGTTMDVRVPHVDGSGTLALSPVLSLLHTAERSYDSQSVMLATFTVVVPATSVCRAHAWVYFAVTQVPYSSSILRYVPSPETGLPIVYKYFTSGIFRGSNAWKINYAIDACVPVDEYFTKDQEIIDGQRDVDGGGFASDVELENAMLELERKQEMTDQFMSVW